MDEQLLVTVSQELPLPDAEDFLLTPESAQRQMREQTAVASKQERAIVDRILEEGLLQPGQQLAFHPLGVVAEDENAKLAQWFAEDPRRSLATWSGDTGAPVRWAADGKAYTASHLARQILQRILPEDFPLASGTKCWVTEDGRDLNQIAGLGQRSRLPNRSIEELTVEAHANGLGAQWDSLLAASKRLNLQMKGFVHTLSIWQPDTQNRVLLWVDCRLKRGGCRVGFDHRWLAQHSGLDEEEVTEMVPSGYLDPEQAQAAARAFETLMTSIRRPIHSTSESDAVMPVTGAGAPLE